MRLKRLSLALRRDVSPRSAIVLALLGAMVGGAAMAGRLTQSPPVQEGLLAAVVGAEDAAECLRRAEELRAEAVDAGSALDGARELLSECDSEDLTRRVRGLHRPSDSTSVEYKAVVLLEEIVSSVDHSMFHIEEDMFRPPTQDVTDTAASNLVELDEMIRRAEALVVGVTS